MARVDIEEGEGVFLTIPAAPLKNIDGSATKGEAAAASCEGRAETGTTKMQMRQKVYESTGLTG